MQSIMEGFIRFIRKILNNEKISTLEALWKAGEAQFINKERAGGE
jgi:hypothetical protein